MRKEKHLEKPFIVVFTCVLEIKMRSNNIDCKISLPMSFPADRLSDEIRSHPSTFATVSEISQQSDHPIATNGAS